MHSAAHEIAAGHRSLSGTISRVTGRNCFLPVTVTGRFSNTVINDVSLSRKISLWALIMSHQIVTSWVVDSSITSPSFILTEQSILCVFLQAVLNFTAVIQWMISFFIRSFIQSKLAKSNRLRRKDIPRYILYISRQEWLAYSKLHTKTI